jgi:hypothetical protein
MNKNEVIKKNLNNSLVSASNLISLTSKLVNDNSRNRIALYNSSDYYLQKKIEIAFLNFVRKNIWLFLPQIINQVKSKDLVLKPYPKDFIIIIEKHDLNYEYPQSFYRTRKKVNLINTDYRVREIKDYIDEPFKKMAFDYINCFIAGKILTEYVDTSIGFVLGLKIKFIHNE